MIIRHDMTTTVNSKGRRSSTQALCSKWSFGGMQIYNAGKKKRKKRNSSMKDNCDWGRGTLASFRVLESRRSSWYMTIRFTKDVAKKQRKTIKIIHNRLFSEHSWKGLSCGRTGSSILVNCRRGEWFGTKPKITTLWAVQTCITACSASFFALSVSCCCSVAWVRLWRNVTTSDKSWSRSFVISSLSFSKSLILEARKQ